MSCCRRSEYLLFTWYFSYTNLVEERQSKNAKYSANREIISKVCLKSFFHSRKAVPEKGMTGGYGEGVLTLGRGLGQKEIKVPTLMKRMHSTDLQDLSRTSAC